MQLHSASFEEGGPIPERCALARPHPERHVELAGNRNPQLAWDDLPAGTRSVVIVCHDEDGPTRSEDVNREGRTVPANQPRNEFVHWAVVDLDPSSGPIEEGEFSKGVTTGGKDGPEGPRGTRHALNDYTTWFGDDPDMRGRYFGYDGPCPPWNDEKIHCYRFTAYALDVPRCPVEGTFDGRDVRAAIEGHVLDAATTSGLYDLRPERA